MQLNILSGDVILMSKHILPQVLHVHSQTNVKLLWHTATTQFPILMHEKHVENANSCDMLQVVPCTWLYLKIVTLQMVATNEMASCKVKPFDVISMHDFPCKIQTRWGDWFTRT